MMLYAKIAAIAIALALAYWAGYDRMKDKHLLFVAEVKAAGEAQEAANKSAVEIAEVITESVKENYENQIAALRTKYAGAGRVCDNGASRRDLPKNAKPARDAYDPTTDPEFIAKCAMTTQQLVSLQQWITKQQEHQK
jgi:hypothetical protein